MAALVGGVPDLISHSGVGILVEPGAVEPIERVAADYREPIVHVLPRSKPGSTR